MQDQTMGGTGGQPGMGQPGMPGMGMGGMPGMGMGGMPPNKMQLKSISDGVFLKDNNTLAALNIGPYAALELVPKVRGGRR